MKNYFLTFVITLLCLTAVSQTTFPINGVANTYEEIHVFTNATIVVSPRQTIENGTLTIKGDKILSVNSEQGIPKGAIVHNLKGKYIYPSFIDLYTDYGIEEPPKIMWSPRPQYNSKTKNGSGWNEAIHPETKATDLFAVSDKEADNFRKVGFGVVLSHQKNGIARGSGVLVTLANQTENLSIINGTASAHYSLEKGTSKQKYPNSLMGTLALIEQTYLDAEWYEQGNASEYNRSLEAWNDLQGLPQLFEVKDKLDIFRIHRIANEYEIDYIVVGNGDEYQRVESLSNTNFSLIIPLNFPDVYDVSNPRDAHMLSLKKMKHWELAPSNPSQLFKHNIFTAFTSDQLDKKSDFIKQIKTAIEHGLSKENALAALTTNPAEMVNMSHLIGTLEEDKLANFLICSEPIFDQGKILSNWIQGQEYVIEETPQFDARGTYLTSEKDTLIISGKSPNKINGKLAKDTLKLDAQLFQEGVHLQIKYQDKNDVFRIISLYNNDTLVGQLTSANGDITNWFAYKIENQKETEKEIEKQNVEVGDVWYPNMAYGWIEQPKPENIFFENATVWTNENEGILYESDVAIADGKIIAIGSKLDSNKLFKNQPFKVINANGMHLTCGIVDEHSHIAISRGVNEGSQASSAEVSIANVINSDDINIYRQLSGGVTSAQLLHGSANPIGGQSGIIKFRWGNLPEDMKFEDAPGFIKFALGENVKQSNWGDYERIRFPQTRMGVEQVFYDHFLRAKAYEKKWNTYNSLSLSEKRKTKAPREDLEMNALLEILKKERFISCHSYVQSEINMLMHVADSMGFTLNTFTHILEGYKVADKMKEHGAGASTFSDWWAYKFEVNDAIPHNASILDEMGVLTAINSDDAEMARRLNQEAAKAVKYGGVSQENAWKMVTLNPAKLLHIDHRVGSIKVGKDADLVLWTDNPLSVYAKVQQTYVDGRCYFDQNNDLLLRKSVQQERSRLIQKMLDGKAEGKPTQKVKKEHHILYHCNTLDDHEHLHGHSHHH